VRITALETFAVPPRWLFLKLSTDEDIAGWGEPVLEGRAATVAAAVEELSDYLVGSDPFGIEDHFQVLRRGGFYRDGPILSSALSGIEQAMWDVKGRALGVPVWELLGGRARDSIRTYAWVGGDRSQDAVEAAPARQEAGFNAIKMNATDELGYVESHAAIDATLARLAAVREACPGLDVAIDFHGRVHRAMARPLLRGLEELRPLFVEEPVLPEHPGALRELRRHTALPLATGERLYTGWGFRGLLAEGAADIIQPDVSHAGGILELRKIAAMAEAYDVAVAPHCPLGPVALAASLQLDACTPNAVLQEQSLGIHYNTRRDLLDYLVDPEPLVLRQGALAVPGGPGLGIEVDEARVREAARGGHRWRNPVWRHRDGTLAEW
jgi:galactonate dehydratase